MQAQTLFREGKLSEAIAAAGALVRENPADLRLRTFLFELLCFAGEYDRAEKHLHLLGTGSGDKDREVGALLYHAALHAERTRQEMFEKGETPIASPAQAPGGTLNGEPFTSIEDADPRIGPRLEIFAAGNYMWLPFEHIASIKMEPPRRLRDLLWAPVVLRTGPDFKGMELGEVLLPALAPLSCRHPDEAVRLGRMTVWDDQSEGDPVPYGQKTLLVDGEEIPVLEIRTLTIGPPELGGTDAST
jgi:type VI secretion system protein ImpE